MDEKIIGGSLGLEKIMVPLPDFCVQYPGKEVLLSIGS